MSSSRPATYSSRTSPSPPTGGDLFSRIGTGAFLLAVALAPLIGGTPVGSAYALAPFGGDAMLGVLRALVFLAAACLLAFPSPVAPGKLAKIAGIAVWAGVGWIVLSLLIHSAFLTNPTFLFAMLPDALNWLTVGFAFTLALRLAGDKKTAYWLAIALVMGATTAAIFGALEYGRIPNDERATYRVMATFFSPNFTAGFLALTLPVAVALFLEAGSLLPLVGAGVASALTFGVLVSTGSRAGVALALVGLVVALIAALIARVSLNWKRVGVLIVLMALAGFAFREPILGRVAANTNPSPTAHTVSTGSDEHSGEFRKETWKGSLKMAQANPVFGAGPGTFPFTYTRFATVAWTGLAHSSYLQIASESGFLALIGIVVGLLLSLTGAISAEKTVLPYALLGGLIAALGRSVFDSEWSLLGNALPVFTVAGLLAGIGPLAPTGGGTSGGSSGSPHAQRGSNAPAGLGRGGRILSVVVALIALVLAFILRAGNSARDVATLASQTGQVPSVPSSVWPPDPQVFSLAGNYEEAAKIEPSGKRYHQWARQWEREGDDKQAIEMYQKATEVEPNNLQTRKALAEAQERTGDHTGAIATYRKMTEIAEGTAGTIRAIPELIDTLPAFAYAALAEDAATAGNPTEAEKQYYTAQQIVEDYSYTPLLYQKTEITTLGANVISRREELKSLYEGKIVPGREAALTKLGRRKDAETLTESRISTIERLNKFVEPTP